MVKAFVIGAGISGLNSARELAKRGVQVTVFEGNKQNGGLAGYTHAFGRYLDLGPHIFHSPDQDIVEYLLNSFPGLFQEKKHYSKNLKNGKYYDYPISREFINSLDNDISVKINRELSNVNPEHAKSATTYYEYIGAIAGPTLRELFFTKYPKKLWGRETSMLDSNWAPKRVEIRENRQPFFGDQWAAVGLEGTYSIINELEKQCYELGVHLLNDCSVSNFEFVDGRIKKIVTTKGDFTVDEKDIVINTISLTKMSKILGEECNVEYRGVILSYVNVLKTKPLGSEVDFIYVDDLDISFNRVSDQNSFISIPTNEDTVLCCEITYTLGDDFDKLNNNSISEITNKDLIKLGLIQKEDILGNHVLRLPEVYPMFSLDYRNNVSSINAKIANISNMYTIGSLAEFAYSDLQILFAKSRDLAELCAGKTTKLNNTNIQKNNINFNLEFELLGKQIGGNNPCFLIAEIGLNHNGSIEIAKKLIDSAVDAGFDAVKLQSYKSEGRSAKSGKTSKYVEKVLQIEESDYELFKKFELTHNQQIELFSYAKSKGVPIFSAPFDIESAEQLYSIGVDAFKVASMEITNIELIKYLSKLGRPLIISTGMSNLTEIEDALFAVSEEGHTDVALLHCSSIYPCPADAINIKAISTLKQAFNVPVGYSDHFHNDVMSILSIGFGCNIIEKHITLDRNLEGPDHVLSLAPCEQISFVKNIRDSEKGIGSGIKQAHRYELKSELRFRKSLYFKNSLIKGDLIKEDDIEYKAPCFGLLPKFKTFVVGSRVNRDVYSGDPITIEVINEF